MEKFQLYKDRTFGDYFSDTFDYLKRFWKNFYKNYFLLNGGAFLVMIIFSLFFNNSLNFNNLLSSGETPLDFFELNSTASVTAIILGILIGVILLLSVSIINFIYPLAHMQLIAKGEKSSFSLSEIFAVMRPMLKKGLIFFLIMTLLIILFLIPLFILGYFLGAALISKSASSILFILIFLLILPATLIILMICSAFLNQGFFIYLNEDRSLAQAIRGGIKTVMSSFFVIMGVIFFISMIVQILSSLISFVPTIFVFINTFTSASEDKTLQLPMIVDAFKYVVAFTLSTIPTVSQGLIYYSHKEKKEHFTAFSDIDSIGK